MDKCYAIATDTTSIQSYIFGSNKLKENLGASFLIEQIYDTFLIAAVNETFNNNSFNINSWKESPEINLIHKQPFEIGYIGGGNALIFFKEKNKAEEFIKNWTRRLLIEAPGVIVAIAFDEFNFNDNQFHSEKHKLFKSLGKNKSWYIPQTNIPRHGITAECTSSGYSLDIWYDKSVEDNNEYVSSSTYAKLISCIKAKTNLENMYVNILGDEFCFTDQLDRLGQQPGEDSHIAIVHVDGNEVGKKFQYTKTLEEIRILSRDVDCATKNAFKNLLIHVRDRYKDLMEALGFNDKIESKKYPREKAVNGKEKKIMPLRYIILGGDDITFVCDGRIGIYLAKKFIEYFQNEKVNLKDIELTACAGISIIKTKYPFYRGYELAEALCKNAKKMRKNKESLGSWLDFHISYGGFSGSLEEIRDTYYQTPNKNKLFFRPYCLDDMSNEFSLEQFVVNTKFLMDKFPTSKIHDLRKILYEDESMHKMFLEQMKARKKFLPDINNRKYNEKIFIDSKTPYFDMIEFMSFKAGF